MRQSAPFPTVIPSSARCWLSMRMACFSSRSRRTRYGPAPAPTKMACVPISQRRRVLAFGTPSDSLLERVRSDLGAGRAASEILEDYRESPLTLRLDTVYVADSTASPLDLTLAMEPGQFTEVVPERSRLAVYLLDAIEAPRAKTFAEARAEVVSSYQDVLEAAWVARLREQYDARTYPERVVGAFQGPRPAWATPAGASPGAASAPTPGGGQ